MSPVMSLATQMSWNVNRSLNQPQSIPQAISDLWYSSLMTSLEQRNTSLLNTTCVGDDFRPGKVLTDDPF